jgi:hypothetical protein
MSEDLQEIERLIKQSAEFSDSLIRLARKLQEQNKSKSKTQLNREQAEDLHALHTKLIDLRSHIDVVKHELLAHRYHHVYVTPQKPADEGLRDGVVDRTITSQQAAQKVRDLDAQLEKEYGDLLTNSASAYHLFEPSDPARARLHELVQQDGRYRTLDEYLSKQRTDSTIRSVTSDLKHHVVAKFTRELQQQQIPQTNEALAEQIYRTLEIAVAEKRIAPDQAAAELVRLTSNELPVSQKIVLRERVTNAFTTGADPAFVIKQFEKAAQPVILAPKIRPNAAINQS